MSDVPTIFSIRRDATRNTRDLGVSLFNQGERDLGALFSNSSFLKISPLFPALIQPSIGALLPDVSRLHQVRLILTYQLM